MTDKEISDKAVAYYREAYALAAPCEWFDIDEGECTVKYMSGNTRYYWALLRMGPCEEKLKRDRNIVERDRLHGNAKDYYKLFYKDSRLVKVENYIDRRLCGYYLCYYFDNARVLKPFDRYKVCDWHYCIVTWFSGGKVVRELQIEDNELQSIYTEYKYDGDTIEFEYANCLPHAKYKEDRVNNFIRGKL